MAILMALPGCCSEGPVVMRAKRPILPAGRPPERIERLRQLRLDVRDKWDPPLPPAGPKNPRGGRKVTLTDRQFLLLLKSYQEQRGWARRLERGYR